MSSTDNYTSYSKSSSLHRPQSLLREPNLHKSKLPCRSLTIDYNVSNNHLTRKLSFKQKLLSIFQNSAKSSLQTSPTESCGNDEVNGKYLSNLDNLKTETKQSVIENSRGNFASKRMKRVDNQENRIKSLDPSDVMLIERFSMHQLNEQIVRYITDCHCSTIKLPSSWINKMGTHLSNSVIMPFITTIPGLTGIENHGNTCYVNVIVQCLAHLDPVAEFFSTKDYVPHVTSDPQISTPDCPASAFDVMVAFSYLVQSLWQNTYQAKISLKFCQLLTMHKREFRLDSQQDAHELLLFILNLLHDNLVKKIVHDPLDQSESGTKPIQLEHEQSFIYDTFRGWLSNEIVCPDCRYTRKSIDQILSLNLPIPKLPTSVPPPNSTTLFYIIVINPNQMPEKHALEVNSSTTIADVRQCLADRLGCNRCDVVVIELNENGFGNLYSDDEELMSVCKKNNHFGSCTFESFGSGLYATSIPNQVVDVDALQIDTVSDNEIYNTQKKQKEFPDNQPFIRILVVHVEKTKDSTYEISDDLRRIMRTDESERSASSYEPKMFTNDNYYTRFTNILTVQAARKTKINLLRHSLTEQMFKYLNLRNIRKLPKPQFIIGGTHCVSDMDMFPLTHPSVNKELKDSIERCGEEASHIRLVVVWPVGTTEKLRFYQRGVRPGVHDFRSLSLNPHEIFNHSSVEEFSKKFEKENLEHESNRIKSQNKININDCLREFFSLDTLSITESWKCPNCQTSQPARTEIRIQEAPQTLILMLKRFTKQPPKPVNDLSDIRNPSKSEQGRKFHSSQTSISESYKIKHGGHSKSNCGRSRDCLNKLEGMINYPLTDLDLKPYMEIATDDSSYLYDLVGVVNHRGSLSNGHYVAICHNSIDNKWRLFDDDRVNEVPKSDVVQPDAYILFYKRKERPPQVSSNLHWSYRRLAFPEKMHRNHSPSPTSNYSRHPRYSERETVRSIDSYSTLPLSVTNNHCSKNVATRYSPDLFEQILSPRVGMSNVSLSIDGNTVEPDEINGDLIDVSKIRSEIIDVDSISIDSSIATEHSHLKTTSSNDSCVKSVNGDSGTALSQDFNCRIQRKKHHLSMDSYSKDECYNSLSTSPSTSSPGTSNTY